MIKNEQRRKDIETFYSLLDRLKEKTGLRCLKDCDGTMNWSKRGVYFFFEDGEFRQSSNKLRVVRVGTHAVSKGSKTTLWKRLKQHKGTNKGTGNHRGSVFRKLVGFALKKKCNLTCNNWGDGNTASKEIREKEVEIEKKVSEYIGKMPFLWLKVEDEPSKNSMRKYIEKNAIALLSNSNKKEVIDKPSEKWMGKSTNTPKIMISGLWNQDHVDDGYEPSFLEKLKEFIDKM